ncbi:hypothetical protein C8J56DRAFT_957380 [Mycena floridula]|nr:hypothetical protein C8J56DRAFT_957380 [Mycena floridula]
MSSVYQNIYCPIDGCKQTVDLMLQSSDGAQIGAHSSGIISLVKDFALVKQAASTTKGIIYMPETAALLRLLIPFWHMAPLPTLEDLDFDTLLEVSCAAEKYLVYSAMAICQIRLREERLFTKYQKLKVVNFAVDHHYLDLADEMAPYTGSIEPMHALDICGKNKSTFAGWVRGFVDDEPWFHNPGSISQRREGDIHTI